MSLSRTMTGFAGKISVIAIFFKIVLVFVAVGTDFRPGIFDFPSLLFLNGSSNLHLVIFESGWNNQSNYKYSPDDNEEDQQKSEDMFW